jgi:hypothetical protein
MKFTITDAGNLLISTEAGDAEMLADLYSKNGEDDLAFMADLLEETGWQPNGQLMAVNPEDIGALTEAPILTDDRTIEDDGSTTVHGKVWWYPNYMVKNFATEMINTGKTEFTSAEPVSA